MTLLPKPFNEFFEDDDWFFPVLQKKGLDPEIDVYETEKDVIAEVNVPDMDPKDIKVRVEDNVLNVRGEKRSQDEEKKKGYYRKEIRRGAFERSVGLPAEVKEDKADAIYEKGILKITLPKKDPSKSTKSKEIKIKEK